MNIKLEESLKGHANIDAIKLVLNDEVEISEFSVDDITVKNQILDDNLMYYPDYGEEIDKEILSKSIKMVLSQLSSVESKTLTLKHGLDGRKERTNDEVAEAIDFTAHEVNAINYKARKKFSLIHRNIIPLELLQDGDLNADNLHLKDEDYQSDGDVNSIINETEELIKQYTDRCEEEVGLDRMNCFLGQINVRQNQNTLSSKIRSNIQKIRLRSYDATDHIVFNSEKIRESILEDGLKNVSDITLSRIHDDAIKLEKETLGLTNLDSNPVDKVFKYHLAQIICKESGLQNAFITIRNELIALEREFSYKYMVRGRTKLENKAISAIKNDELTENELVDIKAWVNNLESQIIDENKNFTIVENPLSNKPLFSKKEGESRKNKLMEIVKSKQDVSELQI